MRQRFTTRRAAFTLLEMLMAMAIGVLLMAGLYVALNTFMQAASAGRVQVDQAQIARQVANLVATDITEQLAYLDVYPTPTSSSSKGASSASSTSSTTSNSYVAQIPVNTSTGIFPFAGYPFNLGVQGGTDWCALFISKVPLAIAQAQAANITSPLDGLQSTDSDLRMFIYFLVPGSGLVKEDLMCVTPADGSTMTLPPSGVDDNTKVLAPEVVAVSFQYYDGTNWNDTWDGTILAADLITPIGPPVSIAITISVAPSGSTITDVNDPQVRSYKRVVQIPTASFFNNAQYATTPTTSTEQNPALIPSTSTSSTSSTTGG